MAHGVELGSGKGTVSAEGTPLIVGAVVGQEHDEGVVELAGGLELSEDFTDALIHLVHHRGEGGHAPGLVGLQHRTQIIPALNLLRLGKFIVPWRRIGEW